MQQRQSTSRPFFTILFYCYNFDNFFSVQVKKFHTQFYNPRNTCVIVCGRVTPEQLFKALEPTIAKLNEKVCS